MTFKNFLRLGIVTAVCMQPLFGAALDDKSSKDSVPFPDVKLTCKLPILVAVPKNGTDVKYSTNTPSEGVLPTKPAQIGATAPFKDIETYPTMQDSFQWKGSSFDTDNREKSIDLDDHTAYLFHVTVWGNGIAPKTLNPSLKDDPNLPNLVSSTWYLYSQDQANKDFVKRRVTPPLKGDQPLLYGLGSVMLFVVQVPDNSKCVKDSFCNPSDPQITFSTSYGLSVAQQTPAAASDFISIVGALGGIASPLSGTGLAGGHNPSAEPIEGPTPTPTPTPPTQHPIPICEREIDIDASGKHLPYDVTINFSQYIPSKADGKTLAPGPPITRTIHALDREPIGFGMGINFPFKQTQISDNGGTVNSSLSHRMNVYAFADLNAAFLWRPTNWFYPHGIGGMPINGQPLHRLFAGLAQPLPFVEKYTTFPISVFGGLVFLREQQPGDLTVVGTMVTAGAFQTSLKTHWVRKPMFGVELPVGQLLGRIKPK